MSILDTLTGGENQNAKDALKRAEDAFANIAVPTTEQLTLPELQKYVQAGILTPAQAQTMLQSGNAYNDIKLDPSSMKTEQDTIGKLKNIEEGGGMTPEMQAQLTAALDQVATTTHGTNAGILDQMAQRGIPASLMGPAAMLAESGDAARTANLTGTQAAGQAEANAISALQNEGSLASTMHGQQYGEEANKAAAENAMRQWNAGATNTTGEANANRTQEANRMNTQNVQDISNQNTGLSNQRSVYNAQIPETIFGNNITKATGQAGVNQAQANQSMNAGNQMMGLIGAGVGAASNAFAPGVGTAMAAQKAPAGYNPNIQENQLPGYDEGAVVPGTPSVPGDSPRNDKVHAMLSPGEVVVPRSIAPDPDAVKRFVQHLVQKKAPPPVSPAHPDDVHSLLTALGKRREETQHLHEDGRDWDFTPGENGSLTTKAPPPRDWRFTPPATPAKVIGNTQDTRIETGSTRG